MTASSVRLGPGAGAREAVAALPVRLPLSPAAVAWLAAAAGVLLPWERASAGSADLARRLSGLPEPAVADDPVEELTGLGAVDADGRVRAALLAALVGFARAEVAVDVDLARRVDGGQAALHAWHRRCGDRVIWLTAAGGRFELGWCDLTGWAGQLTAMAAGSDDPTAVGPRTGLTLPLPLVLATGQALAADRGDLLAALEHHPDVAEDAGQLRLVHQGVRARLQATVAGLDRAGDRRLGLVSWLRYDDGWRSLTPVTRAGDPWVRLDRVSPRLLAAEVARLDHAVRGC
jgi:hypothetical protein